MKLLDELIARFNVKNDRQLAMQLGVSTPVISRIRNKKAAVSADIMIKIHEVYKMPIAEIKSLCVEATSEPA